MAFENRSRGELKIMEILTMNGFEFEEEYSFPDLKASSGWPLRFDFMVFDDDGNLDFAIEFNGVQHYEAVTAFGGSKKLKRQQYNDNQKRQYCRKLGIPLVEIHYSEIDKVDIAYILEKAGI